jgi:hypothetical protein
MGSDPEPLRDLVVVREGGGRYGSSGDLEREWRASSIWRGSVPLGVGGGPNPIVEDDMAVPVIWREREWKVASIWRGSVAWLDFKRHITIVNQPCAFGPPQAAPEKNVFRSYIFI